MTDKLWVEDKMYLVDEPVYDYIDKIEKQNQELRISLYSTESVLMDAEAKMDKWRDLIDRLAEWMKVPFYGSEHPESNKKRHDLLEEVAALPSKKC